MTINGDRSSSGVIFHSGMAAKEPVKQQDESNHVVSKWVINAPWWVAAYTPTTTRVFVKNVHDTIYQNPERAAGEELPGSKMMLEHAQLFYNAWVREKDNLLKSESGFNSSLKALSISKNDYLEHIEEQIQCHQEIHRLFRQHHPTQQFASRTIIKHN